MDKDRMTYEEILRMVDNARIKLFGYGSKVSQDVLIKCAIDIYIAQMKKDGDTDG